MKLNLATLKLWTLVALPLALGSTALAQTTNRVNSRDFTAFKLITERNIFDMNRRPSVRFQPRTNTVVYSFSLVGTMNYEKGLYAVFDGTSEDYRKVLESGGKIATYIVSDITHDSCKLTYGTNRIELRVGMQMRRNTDGSWSAAEQAGETSYAFNSNSRFGNNGRFNRNNNDRNDRSDRRFGNGFNNGRNNNNFRTGDRSFGNSGNESGQIGMAGGGGMNAGGASVSAGAGGGDPNDVVARLMAARAAQLGQGQGQNDGGNQPPDQNLQEGNPNENQNVPNQNQNQNQNVPNENQGESQTGNESNSNSNQNGNGPGTPRT